jgi:hypothetical protein
MANVYFDSARKAFNQSSTRCNSLVPEDWKLLPTSYNYYSPTAVFSVCEEIYRSSVINTEYTPEYTCWSLCNSDLLSSSLYTYDSATCSIPTGTYEVQDGLSTKSDGSNFIFISDINKRTVEEILSINIRRGDNNLLVILGTSDVSVDTYNNRIFILDTVNSQQLGVVLGNPPCISSLRGDTVEEVSYRIKDINFSWSKNDSNRKRIEWNNQTQKWDTLKGSIINNLGELKVGTTFNLKMIPQATIHSFLEGDTSYSQFKVGVDFGDSSILLNEPNGIYVISDDEVDTFDFSLHPTAVAALSVPSGLLFFEDSFSETNTGLSVFQDRPRFGESTGIIGRMVKAIANDYFISPIPFPGEYPVIRFGSRKQLIPRPYFSDADLTSAIINPGEVGFSLSSGKIKFNLSDLQKSDPSHPDFEKSFLLEDIFYDGVQLNNNPCNLRSPTRLLDSSGTPSSLSSSDLFIPDASLYFDSGTSGVYHVLDKTGSIPNSGVPTAMAGGDNLGDISTGLIRSLGNEYLLFIKSKAFLVTVVNHDTDIPTSSNIPSGTVYVSLQKSTYGSRVRFSSVDLQKYNGEIPLFSQPVFSFYSSKRILDFCVSNKNQHTINFLDLSAIDFNLDGISYSWTPTQLQMTLQDVVTSLNTLIGLPIVSLFRNHILISTLNNLEFSPESYNSSFIGFNPLYFYDLILGKECGCDTGLSIEFLKDFQNNLDFYRTKEYNTLLTQKIIDTNITMLNSTPLRDREGLDYDIFYSVSDGVESRELTNFLDIHYDFSNLRLRWLNTKTELGIITELISYLKLQSTQLTEFSFLNILGNYLEISNGSNFTNLIQGIDFEYLSGGITGTILFIENISPIVSQGQRGYINSNTNIFTDLSGIDFVLEGIQDDNFLILDEDAYLITNVSSSQLILEGTASDIYRGAWKVLNYSQASYDPALLVDVVWQDFQHLPEEPFNINVLSPCGIMPLSVIDQLNNRLSCYISEAIVNNRTFWLRYSLSGTVVTLYLLQSFNIGSLKNGLFLEDVGTDRYTTQSFSILLGTDLYTHTSGLIPVLSFSPTPAPNTIEYLAATGELKFASDIIDNFSDVDVIQKEEFLPATYIAVGNAEVSVDGQLNISSGDLLANQGIEVYFSERYIVQNRLDVTVSPISGSVGFRKPLRQGQIVQAAYFPATTSGDVKLDDNGNVITIVEYLPIFVSLEVASRQSARIYNFNPTSKTIDSASSVVVYVGAKRQNFANNEDYIISENSIIFNYDIPLSSTVKISYAVLNCFGGETTFEVSTKPVYRKPFYLEKNQNLFDLHTDRTSEFTIGKLLNIGTDIFYIKSVSYNASTDITQVGIYPTPIQESGSKTPGKPVNNRISSKTLATIVDTIPVVGNDSFWFNISDTFDPIRKNQTTIRIHNPNLFFAKENHLLEINGVPYLVKSATVVDSKFTDIDITSLTIQETLTGTIRLSVRPIFDDNSTVIKNYFPIFNEDPYNLIYYNHSDFIGKVLKPGIDYRIDINSGTLEIINNDYVITSGMSFRSSYTKIEVQGPIDFGGSILYPRYRAKYSQYSIPSEMSPAVLGLSLNFKGSIYYPDSYFVAVKQIDSLSASIEAEVLSQNAEQENNFIAPITNSQSGVLGNDTLPVVLIKDRVARNNLFLLNDLINSFDQVIEMMNCTFIGNSSGYFNFFLGSGNKYTPPGYQNDITGELNNRNLWTESYDSQISKTLGINIHTNTDDFLYQSDGSLNLISGKLVGNAITTSGYELIKNNQKIRNDMDDIIVDGRTRPIVSYQLGVRVYLTQAIFTYIALSNLSRFFTKKGTFYTTTAPGIGEPYPGFYTYGRNIDGTLQSTNQMVIGSVSNNAVGNVNFLQNLSISKRYPRYRIYSYSTLGYPVMSLYTDGKPSVIVSAVILEQFPVDFNGTINTSQFLSLGGTIPDIVTGLTDISLPGFKVGDPIFIGNKNIVSQIFDTNFPYILNGEVKYAPVFIDSIILGCIITFKDVDGNMIGDASRLVVQDTTSYINISLAQGDTILSGSSTNSVIALSDPPTSDEIENVLSLSPSYNIGSDVGINMETGDIIDITKSSYEDGSLFPLKELTGQNPPTPLQDLEGTYFCADTRSIPIVFPSLLGEDKNDSGDYTYPYIDSGYYEKKSLRDLHNYLINLGGDSFLPDALYPFEINGSGTIDSLKRFQTSENLLPVPGPYVAGSSLANARPFDIVLFRIGGTSTVPSGMQGINTVGDVFEDSGSYYLRQPKFVTPTLEGTRIRYIAENVMSWFGLTIEDDGVNTTLTINNTSLLYFNDGTVGNQGGLNNILDHALNPFGANENTVKFRIVHPISGLITQEIEITGDATLGQGRVTSGLGTVNFLTAPVISQFSVVIPATGFVDPSIYSGSFPGTIGPFNFTVNIDTYTLGISGLAANKGSFTGSIDNNRLSFREKYDLRQSTIEGTATFGGSLIESTLDIKTVTGKYSEDITVNDSTVVNGAAPFTFLEKGSFTVASSSGAGDESSYLDVPSFEGFANIAVNGSCDFSVLTSSNNNKTSIILDGEGTCEGTTLQDHQLVVLNVNNGQTAFVETGDILVITESSDATIDGGAAPTFTGTASVKCGTYLVRSNIVSDDFGSNPKFRKLIVDSKFGLSTGWVNSIFPQIVSFSEGLGEITINTLNPFGSPSIIDSPTGHAFPTAVGSRIYILLNLQNMVAPTTNILFSQSIYSAEYTGISGNTFQGLFDWRDGEGTVISAASFYASLSAGLQVSGMVYLPIQMENKLGLPDREVVGINDANAVYGFHALTYTGINGTVIFQASLSEITVFPPGVSEIGVKAKTKVSSTTHIPYESPVYDNVPGLLDLSQLDSSQWDTLHNPSLVLPSTLSIQCILPIDSIATRNGSTEGFRAKAAIYLEPSLPIFPYNISIGYPHVVDNSHLLILSDINMKDSSSYNVSSPGSTDYVKFEIRRARRFYNDLSDLSPQSVLRSCFEIRRGTITGYSQDNLQRGVLLTSGTQFGDFDHPLSLVNDGDLLRLLDSNGNLIESVEILSVKDATTLILASPGIIGVPNPIGFSFQIYKKGHLIPHEQSFDVMLENTTEEVFQSLADFENEEGAYVEFVTDYENSINILKDTTVTGIGINSFVSKGIQVGDYLVVDPQSNILFTGNPVPPEKGSVPEGDTGVINRTGFVAGSASNLDDNRGIYKVLQVNNDNLVVSPETIFTGTNLLDVIFEESTVDAYVVYPTINDSGLSVSGKEGQNDLRPTEYRDMSGSYSSNNYSIAPFTYKIVRPTGIVSDETLQLILTQRERIKSFIQVISTDLKLGYRYWDLQEEEYLTNFEEGLPIQIGTQEEILGLINITPYLNSSTCLSLLDRRYWIKDMTLEGFYSDFAAGVGLPVLYDRILSAINNEEPLRTNRQAWINYRISKPSGTIRQLNSLMDNRETIQIQRRNQIKVRR